MLPSTWLFTHHEFTSCEKQSFEVVITTRELEER